MIWFFVLIIFVLSVFSYGFTDPNLTLSTHPVFEFIHDPLYRFVRENRPQTALLFFFLLLIMYIAYCFILRRYDRIFSVKKILVPFIAVTGLLLSVSYCAFSYDLFNYIATSKVLYHYGENPYVVMPVEIPNDPNLLFTRAANKLALYGPVWLAITAIPQYLGKGMIWQTIIAFKLMNTLLWMFCSYLIYRYTQSVKNMLYFALNPLVLVETLISGHNDLYMMFFALTGIVLWQQKSALKKMTGMFLFICSWFVKGATLILTPLLFIKKISFIRLLLIAYCLLFMVFVVVAPVREELYPWYAVWLVSVVSLMPLGKYPFLTDFTIVFTFALELRHLPYMWMGYYEGPGPVLRLLLTVVPITVFTIVRIVRKSRKYHA